MSRLAMLVIAAGFVLAVCCWKSNESTSTAMLPLHATPASTTSSISRNPFYKSSPLPYQAPPFNEIKDSDYQPAIEKGMSQQQDEMRRIASNTDTPTFENTFVAMERSGTLFNRVMSVFNAVLAANMSDDLKNVEEIEAPRIAAHEDAIYMNEQLFKRIQAVYNERDSLELAPEDKRLVEVVYGNFVQAGSKLSPDDRSRLANLHKEESTLVALFNRKLLAANKAGALVIDDKARLAGLPETDVAGAAQSARDRGRDGKWVFTLRSTTQQPALGYMMDRGTRKKLFYSSRNRAERGDLNDTSDLIARLAQNRAEQARLLGYPNYAALRLGDQMAKTPEVAMKFLTDLVPAAAAHTRREARTLQAFIDQENGGFKLEPWDWMYYARQVRKRRYDLDEALIKSYFELNNVLQNGVFYAANRLYGLTFKERRDIPVYQADVRVFEVFDKDGRSIALFYCDYFARDNKSGGSWEGNFVSQSKLLGMKPVVYNVANFIKPPAGQPTLLSFTEVVTMFHEFGHALNDMFANEKYASLSGTATARDFVEFPSQLNEHWAADPEVLNHYARDYRTGEAMPPALLDKVIKATRFDRGYAATEMLAAALLDMSWHTLDANAPRQNADAFETEMLKREKLDLGNVPPRFRSTYFEHIWGSDYAARYYSYLWTQRLADDGYQWFKVHGGPTRENGDRFRSMILARGNSAEPIQLYREWRGADPDMGPMLIDRGLVDAPDETSADASR
ncbi:M3 family metallopeptidase [Burkholderia ubonensis]|uniref:Dipeptidyl carboxypeptidase n=1 Tax=Burkholderia ubonensis TaxID=101571 RepID=A0ABD6PUN2_9BURK|nr:M3 family metallopeptidase [Burkholderia ubonensis]OJA38091.1 dipeptidyl carboxypeptidase II [Burkholderia ubonensis]